MSSGRHEGEGASLTQEPDVLVERGRHARDCDSGQRAPNSLSVCQVETPAR